MASLFTLLKTLYDAQHSLFFQFYFGASLKHTGQKEAVNLYSVKIFNLGYFMKLK